MTTNSADQGSKPKVSFRRRLLRWTITLVAVLVMSELVLQVFYYATTGTPLFRRLALALFAPDPHCVYRNRPNLVVNHSTPEFKTMIYTNAEGFRVAKPGIEIAKAKPPGTYRIMLLGPSFAYGWGVNLEESFGEKLREILQRDNFAGGKTIELINAGVPSLAASNQLKWYAEVGKEYQPDLVIQFVYGSMIVSPDLDEDVIVDADGFLTRKSAGFRERALAMAKNSALVFYGWVAITNLRSGSGAANPGQQVTGGGRSLEFGDSFDPGKPDVATSLPYYRAVKETVEKTGARLLVVHFPLSYVVHPEDTARWSHLGVTDVGRQVQFNSTFCDYVRGLGVDCLNITDDLKSAGASTRLYYKVDIHWTPAGNLEAAKAVAKHLEAVPAR